MNFQIMHLLVKCSFIYFSLITCAYTVNETENFSLPAQHKLSVRYKIAQNKVPTEPIFSCLYLKDLAVSIGATLQNVSDRELGVSEMQKMYDTLEFVPVTEENQINLTKIANKLADKLKEALRILNNSKDIIERNYVVMSKTEEFLTTVYPYPQVPSAYLRETSDKAYKNKNYSGTVDFVTYKSLFTNETQTFNLSRVFSEYLSSASRGGVGFKQIYFLSTADTVINSAFPTTSTVTYDNTFMWRQYLSRFSQYRKSVVLIVDHGNSLSNQHFFLAKTFANSMIEMLNENDLISVIALAESYSAPYMVNPCTSIYFNATLFVPASDFNKDRLYNFIDSLSKSKGATNHSLGFQFAFSSIKNYIDTKGDLSEVLLVYVSRGLLSSLTDAKIVLETIANESVNLSVPVYVNTVLVIDDTKPLMYEKHFLTYVASLNFSKYNIDHNQQTNGTYLQRGILQTVNSTYNLGLVCTRFYNLVWHNKPVLKKGIDMSLPYCSSPYKDVTVAVSMAVGSERQLGVVGIDLFLNDLVEDIMYSGIHPEDPYIFLINVNGTTIMHKSYQPNSCRSYTETVNIQLLEKTKGFEEVYKQLLNKTMGSLNATNSNNETVKYTWQRILDWYILCSVSVFSLQNRVPAKRLQKVSLPENINLLHHHRLDLILPSSVCRHLKQISTFESGSLYLSASCFDSPYSQLRDKWGTETLPVTLESYIGYMKDPTKLIANPGFKPEVRNKVLSFLHMMPYLKQHHLNGPLRLYAVRRYIASPDGVLEIFPGSVVPPGLEPVHRPWYQSAVQYPGKVILTAPYLDSGGAGYIVTLAHTIYEGKKSGIHSVKDSVIAVVAIDLTLGYFYRLLIEKMPFCKYENIKCFVMDDKGYLISHPSLIDPNGKGPIERTHVFHKESLIASDIVNRRYFVKKNLCNNYADGTMQRYYQFNMSFDETLTNMIHGEHCSKYQITAIPGTNLFVGVVNSTCDASPAFCPCSRVDRLCLNCNRMEQNECECPCECPLNLHKLMCADPNITIMKNPTCSVTMEQISLSSSFMTSYSKTNLKQCIQFDCESYLTHDSCLGIVGCEWCQIDVDGETPLINPFCTSHFSCFNGVLGSVTPYGDSSLGIVTSGLTVSTYSPVGPVVGSIVLLSMILGLILYFYRQNTASSSERLYPDSGPEHGQQSLRTNHLELDDIDDEERDGHRDSSMAYHLEAISPYRISTSYRRPHTTGDSDHGYSTMTPHEESEHLSVALIEPLLTLGDEGATSDVGSDGTSVSRRKPLKTSDGYGGISSLSYRRNSDSLSDNLGITSIPNTQHYFLAPVTVHRNMEAV